MAETPFYNEAAAKELKQQQDKIEQEEARILSDLRKLLQLPEFRRYVWRELERCGVHSSSFNLNAMQMSYNEGARSVGIALLTELMIAKPDAYHQMSKEHYSEVKSKTKEVVDGEPT